MSLPSLKLTVCTWNTGFGRRISFWVPALFAGAFAVSFRGCTRFFFSSIFSPLGFSGGKFQLGDSDGKPTAARTDTKGHGWGGPAVRFWWRFDVGSHGSWMEPEATQTKQGPLNYLIWDQGMQTYGDFEGSPKNESAWFWIVTYFFGGISECKYVTPPKFNMTSPLKNDSWKSILSFLGGRPIFMDELLNFQGVW